MSAREWKPGDVMLAKYSDEPPKRYMYQREFGTKHFRWVSAEGTTSVDFSAAEWTRPLVVLDPSEFIAENLVPLLLATAKKGTEGLYARRSAVRFVADQIEAQTRPPKPAEPTGWLAAVEDAEGNRWTVTGGPTEPGLEWYSPDLNVRRPYDDIDAVRVLSEGIQ